MKPSKNKGKEKTLGTVVKKEVPSNIIFNDIKNEQDTLIASNGYVLDLDFKFILSREVYNKMMTYTRLINEEINGLGIVKKNENGDYIVTDIFLSKQEVTGVECKLSTDGMIELMDRLIAEGKNPSELRFWWHSHNKMGVTWSSTDNTTSSLFGGTEYLFSTVVNHAGKMRTKLNIYNPMKVEIDNIEVYIENNQASGTTIEECKKDILEFVTKKTFPIVYNKYQKPLYGGKTKPLFSTYYQKNNLLDIDDMEDEEFDCKDEIPADFVQEDWKDTSFIEKNLRFVWSDISQKYIITNVTTGNLVTDNEAARIIGFDYNGIQTV